jgi:hypothetical protein
LRLRSARSGHGWARRSAAQVVTKSCQEDAVEVQESSGADGKERGGLISP